MFKWWTERHARRKARRYQSGYDHAAGALLMYGREGLLELEYGLDTSENFKEWDEFNDGVEQAIKDYDRLTKQK